MYTNIPPYDKSGKFILTIEEIEEELLRRRKEVLLDELVNNPEAKAEYYKKIRKYELIRLANEASEVRFSMGIGTHPNSPNHPSRIKKTPRPRKPKGGK